MTKVQLDVWATIYSLHFDRSMRSIDPRYTAEQRQEYMAAASALAAVAANEAVRAMPEEPQ